jgi:hypothetical protein
MTRLDENGKPMTYEESVAADKKAKEGEKKPKKKAKK